MNELFSQLRVSISNGRRRHGWSRRELARRAKVSESVITSLESKCAKVSIENLFKVATILELKWNDVFADKRPYIEVFNAHEFARQKIFPREISIFEITLEYEQLLIINLKSDRQLFIKVLSGQIFGRPSRADGRFIQENEFLVIGGARWSEKSIEEVEIFGVNDNKSESKILVIECPKSIGRLTI